MKFGHACHYQNLKFQHLVNNFDNLKNNLINVESIKVLWYMVSCKKSGL